MKKVKLEFRVEDGERSRPPKWVAVDEVLNAECPVDGAIMVVVTQDPLTAFCLRCQRYYVGE